MTTPRLSTLGEPIPVGQCAGEAPDGNPCLKPTGDGAPRTKLEAWTGRRMYCDVCLVGLLAEGLTTDEKGND